MPEVLYAATSEKCLLTQDTSDSSGEDSAVCCVASAKWDTAKNAQPPADCCKRMNLTMWPSLAHGPACDRCAGGTHPWPQQHDCHYAMSQPPVHLVLQ